MPFVNPFLYFFSLSMLSINYNADADGQGRWEGRWQCRYAVTNPSLAAFGASVLSIYAARGLTCYFCFLLATQESTIINFQVCQEWKAGILQSPRDPCLR